MNSLIILPGERVDEQRAVLVGSRAAHARDQHELKPEQLVSGAVLGGGRGKVRVLSVSGERVELEMHFDEPPLKRENIHVLVAVSRPQTVKKVINIGTTIGATSLHFLRTDNVVKSYLQSKSLLEENIREEVLKGLEQSGDSIAPEIAIHQDFAKFIRESLPALLTGGNFMKVIAHTSRELGRGMESCGLVAHDQPVCIAIGPESGWSDRELADFLKLGFAPVTLGARILRVETALTSLIAQVALLRRLIPENTK